jgi:voltage-gated potassium channel Kch
VDEAVRILSIAVGAVLVLLLVTDVFQSVLLPRAPTFRYRISAQASRAVWPHVRRYANARYGDPVKREEFLGIYAPLALLGFIVIWVGGLVVGFAAIFYGLREQVRGVENYGDALYFSGTTLLTIGFGDIVPAHGPARFVSLLAGASGLGVVAVTTAFLFQLFGSFQQREVFVVALSSRAGSPPSGVTLLETYARLHVADGLGPLFESGIDWTAALLESHLAYPVLGYFRSSHDNESWVATLGALLDAGALARTVIDDPRLRGFATLYLDMGGHAVRDLAGYYKVDVPGDPGIERSEFDAARERLREAGLPVIDGDASWEAFGRIRSRYAASLQAMAAFWAIPPAMWIGDRSALPHGG